jgi:hypothetical protein
MGEKVGCGGWHLTQVKGVAPEVLPYVSRTLLALKPPYVHHARAGAGVGDGDDVVDRPHAQVLYRAVGDPRRARRNSGSTGRLESVTVAVSTGGRGRVRDVFEFQRFLVRVVEDLRNQNRG